MKEMPKIVYLHEDDASFYTQKSIFYKKTEYIRKDIADELLDAIKFIIDEHESIDGGTIYDSSYISFAREAIAKAEGGDAK